MQNKKFAVTGGIGSGKSTVCEILKNAGYTVFSCDEISARLWEETEYIAALKEAFPSCVKDGKLQKSLLSELVFSDDSALQNLNALSHPRIMARIYEQSKDHALSFSEIPLLFEAGLEKEFDGVFAVIRSSEARIRAVKERSGISEKQILARMSRQYDYNKIAEKNCIIIQNDGTREELEESTLKAIRRLGL